MGSRREEIGGIACLRFSPHSAWMHFGVALPGRDAVLALRERLVADVVELVEEWDEPEYVSVKCRDPDGYIVEAAWEPQR